MKIMCSLLTAILFTGLASAQVFTVTDLGPAVLPIGINERGEVAATGGGAPGGLLWSKKNGFKDLAPLPGFSLTFARGINDRGDVVGDSEDEETATFHATLWLHNGAPPIDLGPSLTTNTDATAINDARQVTGTFNCCQSYVWTARTGMVDIGPPPSGILFYEATAISSNGTIVGSMGNNNSGSSFIWTKATGIKRIPVTSSFATGINRGFVIGNSNCLLPGPCDPNNLRAFIWSRRLGSFDLGTLPGQTSSFASGINSRLQVVGDSGNPTQFAFLWTPRFGMVDLNQLIRAPGWVLNNALSINDRAQIVGYGMLNGVLHGFLLTVQRRDKH